MDKSVQEYLTEYFELHPNVFECIYSKSFTAYKVMIPIDDTSVSSVTFSLFYFLKLTLSVYRMLWL